MPAKKKGWFNATSIRQMLSDVDSARDNLSRLLILLEGGAIDQLEIDYANSAPEASATLAKFAIDGSLKFQKAHREFLKQRYLDFAVSTGQISAPKSAPENASSAPKAPISKKHKSA